jgi:hypothetical protein
MTPRIEGRITPPRPGFLQVQLQETACPVGDILLLAGMQPGIVGFAFFSVFLAERNASNA